MDVPIATSPLCSTRAHTMSESRLQYSYWPRANVQRKAGLTMQLHSRRLLNKLSTEFRIPTRLQSDQCASNELDRNELPVSGHIKIF